MARIVVFEGPDKVGKETQSKLLLEKLQSLGYRAVRVEVPTKMCPRTYRLIYKMLHDGSAKKWHNVFQFVQFLNKWIFQHRVLPALLETNDYVIFDRWSLSAIIYGNATGVNRSFNKFLYDRLKKADLTLVFHGKSYRRAKADDSYEKDNDLQEKVAIAYFNWGLRHAGGHALISNEDDIQNIHNLILLKMVDRRILRGLSL